MTALDGFGRAAVTDRPTDRPVLIVEDDEDQREMLGLCLQTVGGIPSVGASNGSEALELLARHQPCVIVLDLMMPVMSGWEFRERQLHHPDQTLARIPVVVLTGHSDPNAIPRLRADHYLLKPCHPETLGAIVLSYFRGDDHSGCFGK